MSNNAFCSVKDSTLDRSWVLIVVSDYLVTRTVLWTKQHFFSKMNDKRRINSSHTLKLSTTIESLVSEFIKDLMTNKMTCSKSKSNENYGLFAYTIKKLKNVFYWQKIRLKNQKEGKRFFKLLNWLRKSAQTFLKICEITRVQKRRNFYYLRRILSNFVLFFLSYTIRLKRNVEMLIAANTHSFAWSILGRWKIYTQMNL